MIKIFKKNQILFLTLGLILVTAGYLNYSYTPELKYRTELTGNIDDTLGDTIYVNAFSDDTVLNPINVEGDSVNQNSNTNNDLSKEDTYFTQTRIERDKMFDEQIDTYKEVLENNSIDVQQKNNAQDKIEGITSLKNCIMIAENLILLKEIEDVVILTNGKNVNVIIKNETELEKNQVAQIYSIINRELEADIDRIQIMLKK